MNKLKFIAIQGDEVIAHLIENSSYGLVIIFLTQMIDITKNIRIFDIEDSGGEIYNQDLQDMIWFPFPGNNNVKDLSQESQNSEDLSGQGQETPESQ